MAEDPVALKVLLRERHWTYGTFCTEYDKAARALDPRLSRTSPSRAQFQRWLAGDLSKLPRPDACRVLEVLFPGWTVEQLFAGYSDDQIDREPADPAFGHIQRTRDADEFVADQFQDVIAVYATRSELVSSYPPHALFDGATSIRACGLSLNLVCQQYGTQGLRRLVERGGWIKCLFLDPDGRAIREREQEENYVPGTLSNLTRINIRSLQDRVRSQLPEGARSRLEIAVYDEAIRFNIVLVDEQIGIVQALPAGDARHRLAHVRAPTPVARSRLVSGVRSRSVVAVDSGADVVTQPSKYMPVALAAMDLASEIVRQLPSVIDAKGDRDMVSNVDVQIERAIRAHLGQNSPEVGFLGEETGDTPGDSGLQWVLDPIDGTANFVKGIPLYAISLALVTNHEPVLGVIDVPADGSRYLAALGWGAFCGDEPLRVRSAHQLRDAIVTVGDYAVGEQAQAKNEARLAVTGLLAQRAQRVRMLGSAAIDLAWLAHGWTDAAIVLGGKPWDTAAGVILVREAGGSVVDAHGQRHKIASTSTVAASSELLQQVLDLVSRP